MILRKTVTIDFGTYRIFECAAGTFVVLDADGRTVDEFDVVECEHGERCVTVKQAFRRRPLKPGVPDLASSFAAALNHARSVD